jgi:hypothetical protein
MLFGYPYRIDDSGRTASADPESYIRDLIEQVLFVSPMERVNRPEFGSDLKQLVFGSAGEALTTAAQLSVQAALQKWLGEKILVQDVVVEAEDAVLNVTVIYQVLGQSQVRAATFSREA